MDDVERLSKHLESYAKARTPAQYATYDGDFFASVSPEGHMTRLTMEADSGFQISTKVQSDHIGNVAYHIIVQAIKKKLLPSDVFEEVYLQNAFYPDANPRFRPEIDREQLIKNMFVNKMRQEGTVTRSQASLAARYNALRNDDMNRYMELTYKT